VRKLGHDLRKFGQGLALFGGKPLPKESTIRANSDLLG